MTTDVDHWSQEEDCDEDEHQETWVSRVVEHGSISFGRFASETLSWERRSVFTHDRRQEELDQFNGLVAKKKAYFEERHRRLRALKASRQSQQTELLLDYDGEGSNTSQSGEEDEEEFAKHETLEDGIKNSVYAPSEEDKTEPFFGQMISCSEVLRRNDLHLESAFLDFTSSGGRSLVNTVEDTTYLEPVQSQPVAVLESSSVKENIEEHKAKENSSLVKKDIAGEPANLESSVNPKISTHESMMNSKSSKARGTQLIKKNQSNKSVLKAKNSTSGTQSGRTLRRGTRSDVVQPAKGIKDAAKETLERAENSHLSRETPITRVNNNTRFSMVASNKPLTETQPESNTPGPFSLVMERRASSRGCEMKLNSQTLSKSALLHIRANGDSRVQNMSRKTAVTTEVKNIRSSDTRRVLNESRKKTLFSENQTILKRAQAPLITSKSRSLNLPARTRFYSTTGTGIQPTSVKENNQKKAKEDMQTTGIIRKAPVSSMTGRTKIAAKALQFQNYEVQRGRRQRPNNPSCDGKPRQEIPKWR